MRVHFIVNSGQRALGAMFTRNLNDEILVFFYPHSARRTFHTFFCPPIKIIALDEEGAAIFEEVVTKWRLIHLPACKYVIEMAPQVDIQPYMENILSYDNPPFPQYGAVEQGVDLGALLFALLSDAVAGMRRIRDTQRYEICPETQRNKFALWERGQGVGGLLAGALAAMDVLVAAPIVALMFVLLGLRRPYVRLKTLAKRRAESLRNNMLIGLSVLSALLSSGVGVQEALRRSASVGGPFCNLLGLLVARMEVEDFNKAIEVTRAHLPDLSDVEANLFLRDIQDFFANNRPVLSSVQGLQESVHRSVVELTEARAVLVRQRSGLFGVLAVVGLVLAIIPPFTLAPGASAGVGAGLI